MPLTNATDASQVLAEVLHGPFRLIVRVGCIPQRTSELDGLLRRTKFLRPSMPPGFNGAGSHPSVEWCNGREEPSKLSVQG